MGNMFGLAQLGWDILGWFKDILGDIGAAITGGFYKLLFSIWGSVASVLDCIQIMFQMLAGVIPVQYTSNAIFANSGNFVMDIILHPFVYGSFFKILVLSFFLLIIFTFVAIVKCEFNSDASKGSSNAKGPIIGKSLKAFFSFLFVPVCCVFGIIASSFLLQALDRATSPSESTLISNKLFACCAYSSNRARIDENFYYGMIGNSAGYNLSNRVVQEAGYTQGQVADMIDSYFSSGIEIKKVNPSMTHFETGDRFDNYIDKSIFSTDNSITTDSYFNCKNACMVFYFYDLSQFNWIVAIISIFFLGSILVSITLGAAVRLYELAILFIISPAIISMMPLDDGPFKQWKKRFIAKVVMVFAPVVALNLYFTLVGTLLQVDFMASITNAINSGLNMVLPVAIVALIAAGGLGVLVLTNIFNLFICIAGAMVCKESIKWLGDMLGADDMLGAGDKLKKGVSDFVKTNAVVGAGIGAAHILGDMSKDYTKGKLEDLSVKKENRTLGKGQLTATKKKNKAELSAMKEDREKMRKNADLRASWQAESLGMSKSRMNRISKNYSKAYDEAIKKGRSVDEAKEDAYESLKGADVQAIKANGADNSMFRYTLETLNDTGSSKIIRKDSKDAYKSEKHTRGSDYKKLKSEVSSGNVEGSYYKKATVDANDAMVRVASGNADKGDKSVLRATNKSVKKFDHKYSEEARDKRKKMSEKIARQREIYSNRKKGIVESNKKSELNEHDADNNKKNFYDSK